MFPRLASDEKIRRIGILPAFPLIVYRVAPGSPAEQAGFKPGDTITRLDDVPMLNYVSFGEYLDSNRAKPRRGPRAAERPGP